MWDELNRLQQALLSALEAHSRLCDAPVPDGNAISGARWQVAQAGRVRMDFLNGTVFAAAEAASHGDELRRVVALRDGTPAYQRHVSGYVARWPIAAILADWTGYRMAAKTFRDQIQARVFEEMVVLRPALRRWEVVGRDDQARA